ncbi:MAG: hypothetical protein R8G66_26075 [Cytophagales bacterium]|nr:hypothetical protein [Cytophagales bacterium]
MIRILLVDDNPSKQQSIKETILITNDINETEIDIVSSTKQARKLLYHNYFDLMILDLVLPIEENGDCNASNGVSFLKEITMNPSIKPPIHIVGISGYQDKVHQNHEEFRMKLWNLITYEEASTGWKDQLNSIIFHLVKTRQRFLTASLDKQISLLLSKLDSENLPITFLGSDWKAVCFSLSNIIARIFDVPEKFRNGLKAKNINVGTLKISSEYDFQNLIHLILRPWIPSTEPENIAVTFDGNTKNADFSIKGNSIIIEAKYIDSTGKKNDTLKTLEGLKDFYRMNSNVKSLLFLILVEDTVQIDFSKIEDKYSDTLSQFPILIKLFRNSLK